ncbi:MBL fold metallo-hydrolase [Aureisphaera galaxeae]|uniref:MBL fold metallo-hydrolase RNA specificity domain-containing protein n=1 Tax=Aureisphaera galaxeae TaxID=1538023 RepID=UPI0023504A08|nr:MBL fold metallo-hydrolase [Aureisphaera galaxeae]MDC8003781.1 MBL fold metallo-hydrolase [Aureisphaera galaxeae]
MRTVKVHFLGASGTVTGSKFLLETPKGTILVDCGLFQGLKELREQNWKDLSYPVPNIDYVLLTHGHLDHVGYLPRLVRQGFRGEIWGTAPTLSIAEIIIKDSAKIHEEEAEKANTEGYSKHYPALPFYAKMEAETTLGYFKAIEKDEWLYLFDEIKVRFRYNGHIIGSTFIEIDIYGKIFVFSGDIGRNDDFLLRAPEKPQWADYLFLESTYGNKLHPKEDVFEKLSDLVMETLHNRGALIIPSFAVERLQTLMFLFWSLYRKNNIPNIPVFIDSPMGDNVFDVFQRFPSWHKLSPSDLRNMDRRMTTVSSYKETWETIDDPRPKVVIAGSGMITGGRVLTYLKQLIDEPSTTVLLVGYQSEGTRGRQLLEGAHEVKFFGKYMPVQAKVHHIEGLSSHADQEGILYWIGDIKNIPEEVFLIHGEATARDVLRSKIQDIHGWRTTMPQLYDIVKILV